MKKINFNDFKHDNNAKKKLKFNYFSVIIRSFISAVATLVILILFKSNHDIKVLIEEKMFSDNFEFAPFTEWFESNFGEVFPKLVSDTLVFDEKLVYEKINLFNDGVKLVVSDHYLVPAIDSGIIVFIGTKEDYGSTLIVQQANGVDVWYSNIEINGKKMYDYVEKGSLLGESLNNEIYLVFEKDGEFLNYGDYIK